MDTNPNVSLDDLAEDLGEQPTQTLDANAKQAVFDLNKQARVLEQQYNIKVMGNLSPVMKTTSQLDYNGRLYALLHIIDNPELSTKFGALKHAYELRHPELEYNSKLTGIRISAKHHILFKERMVFNGIKLPKKPQFIKDYIEVIKSHYMLTRMAALEVENTKLKQLLYDNNSIWYRGIEIKRLTRLYKCSIGGLDITTGLATFDKLDSFLLQIDKLLE